MKRILLIANKQFEVEPILNALVHKLFRPANFPDPDPSSLTYYPWNKPKGTVLPRAVWTAFPGQQFELWCIEDLMISKPNPSSSEGKALDMPKILNYSPEPPSLTVALGTGAYGSKLENHNGCVVMGSNVFIHNYHADPLNPNPDSNWSDPAHTDQLIASAIAPAFFDSIDSATKKAIAQNLLKPYFFPADTIEFLWDINYVALSSVNVTDYKEFPKSDPAAMKAITDANLGLPIGSMESTHGLIRLLYDCPFIFLTGIANRFMQFGVDANGTDNQGNVKTNTVNYTASFNIGVALGALMPKISSYIGV
ncbi:hypothetical protein [Mucilaginibacter kameinonensis]|uniref:hypothetical protein n=1 Tax=Mucilaginibacter kameinonensis TaxID=452286 RepID=UPI000EF7EFDB|nr:hypothetical protein [Mucilaginibacter kameinonensis]